MNNETVLSEGSARSLSAEYVTVTRLLLACTVIFIYGSILHFPDEVQYIWKAKLTLPAFLYLFSKYSFLIYQSILTVLVLYPTMPPRVCTGLEIVLEVWFIFVLSGVQGLCAIRTYALCRGYRPMTIALFIGFLLALVFKVYQFASSLVGSGLMVECENLVASLALPVSKSIIVSDIAVIFLGILAAAGVIYQVWGLWWLRRNLSLRSDGSLVSLLFQQGVLRFLWLLFIEIFPIIFLAIPQKPQNIIGLYCIVFSNPLSTLSLCNFTLALRRRNMRGSISNPPTWDLSTLSLQAGSRQSVQTVLGRLQEDIMSEMGERNGIYEPVTDNPPQEEVDHL